MSFKKNKYVVIKEALSKEMATFLFNYFLMKKQVYETCLKHRYISPYEDMMGNSGDSQVQNTYAHYADNAMETLLLKLQPLMEKNTGLKLSPAYSYARLYKKGDILEKHKDRFSCEISTTLALGGDLWSIYIEPSGKYRGRGIKVDLNPGDMLVYRGCELEHWRNKFKGKESVQVFLHYNNKKTRGAKLNLFDGRPHLGLPNWFKDFNKLIASKK